MQNDQVEVDLIDISEKGDSMYVSKENPVIQEVRSYESNLDRAYKENRIGYKRYIKNFIPTKHLITRWFNILNEEIFNNEIYPFHEIEIIRKQGCHAEHIGWESGPFVYGELSMNNWFWNKSEFIYTIAHEMIHQWQWMNFHKTNHGRTFMKWKDKLRKFNIPLGVEV